MFLAIGALGGSGLVLSTAEIKDSDLKILLPYYSCCGIIFVIASKFVLTHDIWGPAVYMFLCSSLTMYFFGTLQGFYTFRNKYGLPSDTTDRCEGWNETLNGTCPHRNYCLPDS